jgi:glycosyltransferase involved in cell wall biosynthesis
MKISVVIPLYNKAPHIIRAIDSILNQSLPASEIIVVDDGSTDGGRDIVNSINNPKIKLIRQENMGPTTARNTGIKAASNDLIAFLDADDEWMPDFLEIINTLRNNFPDCGAYATSSFTVRPSGAIFYPDISFLPPEPWIGIIPNIFTLLQHGLAFNSSCIVIPKDIIKDIGGFPVWYFTGDIDTWIRIGIKYPIAFSPKRKAIYHQDAKNRTAPRHPSFVEYPVVGSIQKYINSGEIAKGNLRDEASEYIAYTQINVAIENILFGYTKQGVELLNKCKYTKKYKMKWLFWRFWSYFPAFVPKMSLAIKDYFRTPKL